MNHAVDYITTAVGLRVKFTNLSSYLLEGQSFEWDFGDGSEISEEKDPVHLYDVAGSFFVSLSLKSGNEIIDTIKHEVRVTDKVKTQLSQSIYCLIDQYIPKELTKSVTFNIKRQFIEKWQLYIQPLVNHNIPLEEYNNELYYEALENQLIMELAAYDFLSWTLAKSLESSSVPIQPTSSEVDDSTNSNGRIKKISTGPTEVEYFDDSDSNANVIKAINSSGILDMLKLSLCGLSDRLDIYLPMCRIRSTVQVPKVVNRRNPGPLDGPDPSLPIRK